MPKGVYKRKGGNQNNLQHGFSRTRTYQVWRAMLCRCFNKKHKHHRHYGGRGITVHIDWMKFDGFLRDMGPCPTDKSMIDRIDNNKGYFIENCRWATNIEQQNNRRNNVMVTYKGKRMTATQMSRTSGISIHSIYKKVKKHGIYDYE